MLKLSVFLAALALTGAIALTGTIAIATSEAQAQASAMEKCIAACRREGGKRCENYCQRRR